MRLGSRLAFCIAALAAFALPSFADTFPTYSYFNTCASGVVDCSSFQVNYHGDFGMNGLKPENFPSTNLFLGSRVVSSNARGEVIGFDEGFFEHDVTYGFGGHLWAVTLQDTQQNPISINDNGLFLWYVLDDPLLGRGSSSGVTYAPLTLSLGVVGQLEGMFGIPSTEFNVGPQNATFDSLVGVVNPGFLGLNDDDQVLIGLDVGGRVVEGVLSPSAIPEPPGVALLVTILVLCTILVRRRKRSLV